MSHIASIPSAARTFYKHPLARPPTPKATGTALTVTVSEPKRRASHYPVMPQLAAYSTQLLAGAPRRGLKAPQAEQARVFTAYARTQNAGAFSFAKTRAWA